MLFFIYFHLKIGPTVLISVPKMYREYITEEDLDQIKRLMDAASEGFFFHTFSPQLKTANYFFTIQSPWARGRMEMLMVSHLVQESNPDLVFYERILTDFVTEFQNNSEIYKGIYKDYNIQDQKDEIDATHELIKEKINDLSKKLQQAEIQTKGELISLEKLCNDKMLRIPSIFIEELQNLSSKSKNCFIIYKRQKDSYEIKLLPINDDVLVKISVFFQQLNPATLKQVITVLQTDNQDNVVFSSGLCTQGSTCIYEVYIKFISDVFNQELEQKIYQIQNISKVLLEKVERRQDLM